jgi:hypothetical protein
VAPTVLAFISFGMAARRVMGLAPRRSDTLLPLGVLSVPGLRGEPWP